MPRVQKAMRTSPKLRERTKAGEWNVGEQMGTLLPVCWGLILERIHELDVNVAFGMHTLLNPPFSSSVPVCILSHVYGVEACRATTLSEVHAVFGSYGISVNPRLLALIADFIAFQGGYRACNRLGIICNPSSFLKMSFEFETATVFLMDATLQKHSDYLELPSARIFMGRIVEMGTGSFDLLQNIDTMIAAQG